MVTNTGEMLAGYLLCLMLGLAWSIHGDRYQRFCYFSSWARFRQHPVSFIPENIDVTLCTHVAYAFATLDETGTKMMPSEEGDDPEMYKRFNDLKKRDLRLRTLLSLGGWAMGSPDFSRLVSSDSNIQKFANNAVRLLRSRGFDGLDIDWEFPASRGSPPGDKERFTKLIQIVRRTFDKEATRRRTRRLLLTAALGPSPFQIRQSYEPRKLARFLDYINLMTYDMHGIWDRGRRTFHHAALYGSPSDRTHNIDYVTRYWTKLGVPKRKLLVGLPFYSRTYTTLVGSSTFTGPGQPGQYTHTKGYLAYYEVCELLKEGVKGNLISSQRVPYIVDRDQWMGYDDEESLKEKVRYVVSKNLGGIMVWALDLDDFHGMCGKTFPLMNAVNEGFASVRRHRRYF